MKKNNPFVRPFIPRKAKPLNALSPFDKQWGLANGWWTNGYLVLYVGERPVRKPKNARIITGNFPKVMRDNFQPAQPVRCVVEFSKGREDAFVLCVWKDGGEQVFSSEAYNAVVRRFPKVAPFIDRSGAVLVFVQSPDRPVAYLAGCAIVHPDWVRDTDVYRKAVASLPKEG